MTIADVEATVLSVASDISGMPVDAILGSSYLYDVMEHLVFLDFVSALASKLAIEFDDRIFEVDSIREVIGIATDIVGASE